MAPSRLSARLVAPAEVNVGDKAKLSLTVYNKSSSEVQIFLGGNELAFDPIVRQGSVSVWQRSITDGVIMGGLLAIRFAPGDSLTFEAVWPLTDSDGHPVSPGVYEITALLKDDQRRSIIGDNIKQVIRVSPR